MNKKKIFITGASGCVGRYIIDELIGNAAYELHLFVRNKTALSFLDGRPNVVVHEGDMSAIEALADVLAEMDTVVHVATPWGNSDYTRFINVDKTYTLFELSRKASQFVYFSTASILGANNQLLPAAAEFGTSYIQSKYHAYNKIRKSPFSDKTAILFPTMVLGGAPDRPWSHVSGGLRDKSNLRYLKWLRYLVVDGEFHFIHAQDIATVVGQVVADGGYGGEDLVLGYPKVSAKTTVEMLCKAFDMPISFRFKVPVKSALYLAGLFGLQLAPWDRHCIRHPHFVYKTVVPSDFGRKNRYPALDDLVAEWRALGEA